jgi:hypothetical protein
MDWMLTPEEIEEACTRASTSVVALDLAHERLDVTAVRVNGQEAACWRISPDGELTEGLLCLSCGSTSDWFGNLPCGH